MPKRPGSAVPPLIGQRRFEASRLERQLWSEAYEYLVPERRRPLARSDAAAPGGGQAAPGASPLYDSQEGKCA